MEKQTWSMTRHLINFLNICRKNTLTLNPDKMQFRLPQVSFFGHQWSAKGLSPDPKKIAAVRRMDLPRDVETMRSFLGLVNYLNRFSPHVWPELSEPLREVCRQDTEFQLTKSVHVAFSQDKGGNFQEHHCFHTSIQGVTLHYKQIASKIRAWCSYLYRTQSQSCLHLRVLTGAEKKLSKPGEGMLSNNLGHGEISLFSLW